MNMIKRITGTLILPVIMFLVMLILCYSNGKMYFGTWRMWQTLIPDIAVSVACAMGIGLQYKSGRFDFSGGAIMLLTSIIAGNVARNHGNNLGLLIVLCILISVGLSLGVALFYIYGKVPIVITTIGFALLYESITCLIYDGSGVNLVSNMKLRIFSSYPYVLIPFALAIAIYALFSYKTTAGKRADLLANNQQSAVNIGINENRNAIISFVFSGLIFGCATLIYISSGIRGASYTALSTAGQLFNNILPVFIGMMLANFCGTTIGTIMGSLTLCLLSYGMSAVFSFEMGSAITTICTGIFILLLNVLFVHGIKLLRMIARPVTKKNIAENS